MTVVFMIFLESQNAKVVIDPKSGGRIISLILFGYDILVPESPDPIQWGCYPMAPWAGRVRNGRFSFKNKVYQLPQLMPPHAIHGTTYLMEWQSDGNSRISTSLGEHWPFPGRAIQHFELAGDSLKLRLEVHAEKEAFPCSIGWHPWFRRRLANNAGETQLLFKADSMYAKDEEGIATGEICTPTAGPWDDCFTQLRHPPRLIWPDILQIELRSTADHWVIYNERDDAICVEPQTGPPDSLNTMPALVKPGQPMVVDFEIRWCRLNCDNDMF